MTSGEISSGRNRAVLLAVLGVLCLVALAPAAASAASISGTVTDASTLEPIEGLEVCAYSIPEEWEVWFCEETDADGEYTIEGLDPDEYAVEFWGRPQNYIPQFYDGREAWWEADPVVVESGDAITGIDAEMVEGGSVEGTVLEAGSGLPLEEIYVCAWEIVSEQFGGCVETDSAGEYALGGMPAGEFEIEFWPAGRNFIGQYYDHKDHWWEADPVTVALGSTATGIDADLEPGAGVEGQVRQGGSPVMEVEVCAWSTDPEGAARCTYPGEDGHYAINGLPGDEYKVEFWPFEESLSVQFWDHKASWEAADPLLLSAGNVATGIDADFGAPAVIPPVVTPPTVVPPVSQPKHHRKRCKKGFRKKRIHGKVRCVKKKKHKHHVRATQSRPGVPDRGFRFGR